MRPSEGGFSLDLELQECEETGESAPGMNALSQTCSELLLMFAA